MISDICSFIYIYLILQLYLKVFSLFVLFQGRHKIKTKKLHYSSSKYCFQSFLQGKAKLFSASLFPSSRKSTFFAHMQLASSPAWLKYISRGKKKIPADLKSHQVALTERFKFNHLLLEVAGNHFFHYPYGT